MANVLWEYSDNEDLPTKVQHWLATAERGSALLVSDVTQVGLDRLSSFPGLENFEWEIYPAEGGTSTIRFLSNQSREFESRRATEHRELLLVLQEALIDVAKRDQDLASKLAARAYVNLKTDPTGQRRYDGLLHRFTGVLHRKNPLGPSMSSQVQFEEKTQEEQ